MHDGLGPAARETRSPPRAGGNIRQRTQRIPRAKRVAEGDALAGVRMPLFKEIANFKNQSGVRRLRYVVNPRGVSSHHVLIRAFGDAS